MKMWLKQSVCAFSAAACILILTMCSDDNPTQPDQPTTGTVTDIDGNVYKTIRIGEQWWMAENLRVTRFRNGDPVPKIVDSAAWIGFTTGAYCEYDSDGGNVATYGRLYNWYAVADSRTIAPVGWHVPSDAEWKQLELFLGMSQAEADAEYNRGSDEGGKMKESGTTHWIAGNLGATNTSGFSGLPGGYRHAEGYYGNLGMYGYWWCSTEFNSGEAWWRNLFTNSSQVFRYHFDECFGLSVRCVKD